MIAADSPPSLESKSRTQVLELTPFPRLSLPSPCSKELLQLKSKLGSSKDFVLLERERSRSLPLFKPQSSISLHLMLDSVSPCTIFSSLAVTPGNISTSFFLVAAFEWPLTWSLLTTSREISSSHKNPIQTTTFEVS